MLPAAKTTLRESHIAAAQILAADPHLRDNASRDAATLLLRALNLPPTALYSQPSRILSVAEAASFNALLARRLNLEPIQYILGQAEFYGLTLRVTPATLIPRPETELLVEAVLARLPQGRELRLLDIGTGSGAIAIALAHHLPHASILALDLSPEALAVAADNATSNHVADRIDFCLSDLLAAVTPADRFDAILSNPPYIPAPDRPTLHPQVRDHEPPLALFAGPDGLDIYRRLIPQAEVALNPGGLLALEIGYAQAEAVTHLLGRWNSVELLNDLQAIPRVALARRP